MNVASDADAIDMTGAREVYKLLDELEGHIGAPDASGRALLYQAKERIRLLIISIDRSNAKPVSNPRASSAAPLDGDFPTPMTEEI